jgi:Cdc6-like AAA superfamily ATPase
MAATNGDKHEKAAILETVFRPARPINSLELFSGRQAQSRALVSAVNQLGRHAVLFGERGVGKSSLANILFYLVQCPGYPKIAPIENCLSADTFGSLWSRVFNQLSRLLDELSEKDQPVALPKEARRFLRLALEPFPDAINMDAVKTVLNAIGEHALLIVVLDEFNELAGEQVRREIAEAIKYLSDRGSPATIVLIGVADDVNELIQDHRSIERCLAQVNMPRMSRDELEDLVMKHLARVGMTAEPAALHEISRIASGLPHYGHLLGLYSGVRAIECGSETVLGRHVSESWTAAIDNSQHTVKTAYIRAVESSQKTAKYREVLTACAMAKTNELGYFSPTDAREPLSLILKKPARIEAFARHLHTFCGEDGGPVLQRMEFKGHPQFRFINPLMQPFALMKALNDGLITEDDLKATRDPDDPQKRLF